MKAISLFSGGCDGLSLSASWAGIETLAMCECDPHCRVQLRRREPDKPIFQYDTEVTPDGLRAAGIDPGGIDIILASPPCQCASVAGKRLGADDERNRWPECLRIIRDVRSRWFFGENVPGLLSVNSGKLFASILGELAEMGYDVGWSVFGADDVGAPHRRDRLAIVAYLRSMRELQPKGRVGDIGGWAGDSGQTTHAERRGLRDDSQNKPETAGDINALASAGVCCGELGDADSERREEQNIASGISRTGFPTGRCETNGGDGTTQSQMGFYAHGVLSRLANQRWPAYRNQPQYPWEPPRTATGIKGRAPLIKMLGNSVCPQWAVVILAAIAAINERIDTN